MNNSIKDMSNSDIPPSVKILLRIFLDRIRRNRNEVPSRRIFDLVEETTPQENRNITTNVTRIPEGLNVDMNIKMDNTDGKTENAANNDDSTSIDIDVARNAERTENQKASEAVPDRSAIPEMWESQLEDWIIKWSQKVGKDNDENEHPKRIKNATCRVGGKAFETVTPPEVSDASETWTKQLKNVAKQCSDKVEDEPEELTESEQERHINPDSHTDIKCSVVLENAAEEKQFDNDTEEKNVRQGSLEEIQSSIVFENAEEEKQFEYLVGKYSETPEEKPHQPTGNVDEINVHQSSFEDGEHSQAYPYRGRVPSKWYSNFISENRFQYGRQVEALVMFFESLHLKSMAMQRGEILTMKPSMKRPRSDQQTLNLKVQDAHMERHKASVGESANKSFNQVGHGTYLDTFTETPACQADVVAKNNRKRSQQPEPPLEPSLNTDTNQLIDENLRESWRRSKQSNIKRKLSWRSHDFFKEDFLDAHPDLRSYFSDVFNKRDLEGALDQASSDSGLSSQSDASESTEISTEGTRSGYDQQRILRDESVENGKSTGDVSDKSDEGNYEGRSSSAHSYRSLGEASIRSSSNSERIIRSGSNSERSSSNSEIIIGSSYNSEISIRSSSNSERIKTRSLPSVPEPSFTPTTTIQHYESIPEANGELRRQRAIQRETIYQASKAALICRSRRKAVKQDIQVEAEKILLVATRKRDVLDELLQRSSDTPKDKSPISVSVSMKNINFSTAVLMSKNKFYKKYSWFFMLVVEAGTKVLASSVVQPEATEIVFKDSLQFEGHSEDFAFDVKLFGLALDNQKKKNKTSRPTISAPISLDLSIISLFNLWGKAQMKPSGIWSQGRNCFELTQILPDVPLSNVFSAETETHLKIQVFKRGFLTVGVNAPNRLPVWNRKWCVLDGVDLKYWNYPNEENVCKPVVHLDLTHANSYELHLVNKQLCPWPRSFSLKMGRSGSAVREYFMNVETLEEFNEWRNQLNLVLGCVSRWSGSRKEVECGE